MRAFIFLVAFCCSLPAQAGAGNDMRAIARARGLQKDLEDGRARDNLRSRARLMAAQCPA